MGALTHNGEVLQRLPANASQVNFDKTGTNLNSTQTENAIKEVNTKVNTLQSEKADTDIVASDFSTATSYTAGDYCIYEGNITTMMMLYYQGLVLLLARRQQVR